MNTGFRLLALLATVLLSGCASTFQSTFKDPEAAPLEFRNQKVIAVVLLNGETSRNLAEDRLAQQIAAYGAQGYSMHRMFPNATVGNEQATRTAMEAAGVKGVVVMRPIYVDRKVRITEHYQEPSYASFWGGYYGTGFAISVSTGSNEPTVTETKTVYVETLVYSLKQNKLVWGGRSKTTDADTLAELIQVLAKATVSELKREGLTAE